MDTLQRRHVVRRPGANLLILVAVLAIVAGACASTTPGRLVQAIEIGADLHRETMIAAGAASVPILAADGVTVVRPPVITGEQLERIRVVGRRAELTLRGARAAVDLYLAARQLRAGADQPAAEASAAVAAAQAAILDLVRVAAELGLEARHAGG